MLFARSYLNIFQNLIFNYLQVIRFLDASLDVFLVIFLISDNQSWLSPLAQFTWSRSLYGSGPKWSVVCNYPEQKPPTVEQPHHHAPTGIYPANTSSWANWPLTVCLAALKNHQSVSDRLFSNSVSSVQLIVNTSPRVSKYHVHVRGQLKTLPCSELQPSKVMFEEKIRSLSCLWW